VIPANIGHLILTTRPLSPFNISSASSLEHSLLSISLYAYRSPSGICLAAPENAKIRWLHARSHEVMLMLSS